MSDYQIQNNMSENKIHKQIEDFQTSLTIGFYEPEDIFSVDELKNKINILRPTIDDIKKIACSSSNKIRRVSLDNK